MENISHVSDINGCTFNPDWVYIIYIPITLAIPVLRVLGTASGLGSAFAA